MSPHTRWSRLRHPGLLVALVCLLVCVSSVTAVAAIPAATQPPAQPALSAESTQSASTPQIRLSLDGTRIDADRETVDTDPTLTVNASVGDGVSDGTTLETVTVRVNSNTYRSYNPDTANFSIDVELPLRRGNNSLTVITEDSADNVNSRQVTVAKDDLAPWVGLTEPYSTDLRSVIPNGTVDTSLPTLGFRVGDFSPIQQAVITTEYNYSANGQTIPAGDQEISPGDYQLPTPGKRFSQDVLLGYGNNTVNVQVTDIVGNTREQTFTLNVTDDSEPTIALDLYPQQTTNRVVSLSGTISDNVWVQNASVEIVNLRRQEEVENVTNGSRYNYTRTLRFDTAYEHAESGRSVQFDRDLNIARGDNQITIRAADHLGQTVERTFIIERLESPEQGQNQPPSVTIDRTRTRVLSDGRVRLVANVTDPDFNLDTIEIETENLTSGNITDYEQFANVGNRRVVGINTTLRAINGPIAVSARARDENGQEDVAVQQLRPNSVPEPTTPTPSTPDPTTPTAQPSTVAPSTPAPSTPTAVPPTPAAPQTTTAANGTTTDESESGGGIVGGIVGVLGAIVGFIVAIMPFVIGGVVFVTTAYFALRKVREEGGGQSAS